MSEMKFKSLLWATVHFERRCFNCNEREHIDWEVGIAIDKDNFHYIIPLKGQPYYYKPPCAVLQYSGQSNTNNSELFDVTNYKVKEIVDVIDKQTIKLSADRWQEVNIVWTCRTCKSRWALTWADSLILTNDKGILLTMKGNVALTKLILINGDCQEKFELIRFLDIPLYLYDE